MKKKTESAWLSHQVDLAKKSLNEWPEWMKRAARFEGGDVDMFDQDKSEQSTKEHPSAKESKEKTKAA